MTNRLAPQFDQESRLAPKLDFKIDCKYGVLSAGWKLDLEDEEFPGYLPQGYSQAVLELKYIEATARGDGQRLMKAFLASKAAQQAELVFLDPCPGEGHFFGTDQATNVDKLVRFYQQFGFRHNPESATKRMWLVRKGQLKDSELPT